MEREKTAGRRSYCHARHLTSFPWTYFGICLRSEVMMCELYHQNLKLLRSTIRQIWQNIENSFIKRACDSFRSCTEREMDAEDDFIE